MVSSSSYLTLCLPNTGTYQESYICYNLYRWNLYLSHSVLTLPSLEHYAVKSIHVDKQVYIFPLLNNILFIYFSILRNFSNIFFVFCLRQLLPLYFVLAWNLLYRPGCPQTYELSSCLCLPKARITGVHTMPGLHIPIYCFISPWISIRVNLITLIDFTLTIKK